MAQAAPALLYGPGPRILFAPANQRPSKIVDHDWRPFDFNSTCRAAKKPRLLTAGLFNTGTNFVFQFSRIKNCVDRKGGTDVLRDLPLAWQVEYSRTPEELNKSLYRANQSRVWMRSGKHTYLRAIQHNYNPGWSHSSANKKGDFVLVVVRHPLSWIASMCKRAYVCGWQREHRLIHGKSSPSVVASCLRSELNRTVYCNDNRGHHHADLSHLWADWYRAYASPHWIPRIFIRYEDLLLHPLQVWSYLCQCIGASAVESISFESTDPRGRKISLDERTSPGAKTSSASALEHSITKAKAVGEILRPYTTAQLTSLSMHARDLLHLFGYRVPGADSVGGAASK